MKEGREPLRTFGDLAQFLKKSEPATEPEAEARPLADEQAEAAGSEG